MSASACPRHLRRRRPAPPPLHCADATRAPPSAEALPPHPAAAIDGAVSRKAMLAPAAIDAPTRARSGRGLPQGHARARSGRCAWPGETSWWPLGKFGWSAGISRHPEPVPVGGAREGPRWSARADRTRPRRSPSWNEPGHVDSALDSWWLASVTDPVRHEAARGNHRRARKSHVASAPCSMSSDRAQG
jgi:hypothetical protein